MITIDGDSLTVDQVLSVSARYEEIRVSDGAFRKIEASHKSLMKIVTSGKRVYGVTTGFGSLLNVDVEEKDIIRLQANLIRSHSSGYGDRLPELHVRAMMLVRLNSLCRGYSGVSRELIEFLTDMINKKIHPVVPRFGSVGASGDLAPLAHIALAMMGEGLVISGNGDRPSNEVLEKEGMNPYSFGEKEGVAFINGTSTISGILAVETALTYNLFDNALNSAVMSFEALKGTDKAFTSWAIEARGHNGQKLVAEKMRKKLLGSENVKKAGMDKVQDPYTLRCIPQVYGAVLDTLDYVRNVITVEINSVTDNPLVNGDEYVSVGNFHGEPVAFACDFLAIALTDLGNMIERRLARITDTNLSGLPPFLVERSGFNSGYMIPQYTAAALCNRNKTLSNPSSADTIPTSANQEDHVSMGANAAFKLSEIVKNLEGIIGIEYLLAAQALEFITEPVSETTKLLKSKIRENVERLVDDRPATPDIDRIVELMRNGYFLV